MTKRYRNHKISAVAARLVLVGCLHFFMSTSAISIHAAHWEPLAALPEPNGGSVSGAVGGQIVLAGGTMWKDDVKHWLRRIHAYDPKANAWRETGLLQAPVAYAAAGEYEGALWFAGGSSGSNTHLAVWKIGLNRASTRMFTLRSASVLAGSAVVGSTLYALGGTDDMNHLERATNTFLAIDLRNGRTTKLPDYPEPSFITGATAACGSRFFAFGGARWDTTSNTVANLSSAYAFNTVLGCWEKLTALPYEVRGLTALTLDDQHILLAGGYKNDAEEFTSEAFIYDVGTGRYTPTHPLPYKAMVSLVKSEGWVYCLGGEDRKRHRSDAMFRIRVADLLRR